MGFSTIRKPVWIVLLVFGFSSQSDAFFGWFRSGLGVSLKDITEGTDLKAFSPALERLLTLLEQIAPYDASPRIEYGRTLIDIIGSQYLVYAQAQADGATKIREAAARNITGAYDELRKLIKQVGRSFGKEFRISTKDMTSSLCQPPWRERVGKLALPGYAVTVPEQFSSNPKLLMGTGADLQVPSLDRTFAVHLLVDCCAVGVIACVIFYYMKKQNLSFKEALEYFLWNRILVEPSLWRKPEFIAVMAFTGALCYHLLALYVYFRTSWGLFKMDSYYYFEPERT